MNAFPATVQVRGAGAAARRAASLALAVLACGLAAAGPQNRPADEPASTAGKSKPVAPAKETPQGEGAAPGAGAPGLIELPAPLPAMRPSQIPPPLFLEPAPPPEPEQGQSRLHSASEIIRAILGLVGLAALAYLAGQPRVRKWERKLGISQLVTAGLPFVVLGAVAHLPGVGVLSDSILWEIRPLLALGLGWIGFTVGFRFDARLVESLSPGMTSAAVLTAAVPFASIIGACALLLLAVGSTVVHAEFLRDALILGAAGAMAAQSTSHILRASGAGVQSIDRVWSIVQVEQLAAILGLMFTAAYFRPTGLSVAWQLPGTAWLFIALGVGTTMGGLIYAILGKVKEGPEFSLLILGSVSFTAGMASFLRLSPVAVCFIAAAILANLPGGPKEQIRRALVSLERPIYLLFLVVAGSLWRMSDWRGWALMALFVLARLGGKWLAVKFRGYHELRELTADEKRALVYSPMGALAIAIVVSAQDLYFGPTVTWIVSAVIGGAMVTEVIVQVASRNRGAPGAESGDAGAPDRVFESAV